MKQLVTGNFRNKVIVFIVFCFTIFITNTSCSDEKEDGPVDGRVAVHFNTEVVVQEKNRAVDSQWNDNDKIGIFMFKEKTTEIINNASNKMYSHQGGGAFAATDNNIIYYPVDGSRVDFIAYYPFNASLIDYKYPVDVSLQDNQSAIDLMWSNNATGKNKEDPSVSLNFIHKLSKIKLRKIEPGEGITPQDLQGLSVEITGLNTTALFDVDKGLISEEDSPATIILQTAADGSSAQGIILPSKAKAGRTLIFTLKETKEKFIWNIPDNKEFKSGEENIYDVKLQRTNLQVTSSVKEWEPGNGPGENIEAE